MDERPRKWWGWGYADEEPPTDELRAAGAGLRAHFGFEPADLEQPADLDAIALPKPRLSPPPSLAPLCSSERYDRVTHAYGKAYRDIVRAFRGRIDHPPDVVARPREEADVARLLDWCADAGAAVVPFGGGTSVVGGVEPRALGAYAGSVSLDLRSLDRVLEVDSVSGAARIEAGALGPELERELHRHGLTLRHFPQSFELSTLGGWIATRSGGHFATLQTHIDDLVESVRAITPAGAWESRRLPGSGAGPSPDRMLIGSEGALGVITEAWVRVRSRPRFREAATASFASFDDGCAAVRAIVASGLWPSNCRLLDGREAELTGARSDGRSLLMLGFESADAPRTEAIGRAVECARDHGGESDGPSTTGDAASTWRSAFLRAPYLRDTMICAGIMIDTFETAAPWTAVSGLVRAVRERIGELVGGGIVTCRLTHAYPDGAAPYFTVIAPARRGAEVEQWDEIKAAASDLLIESGATITHHHAVGRDHRPWYDRQRPDLFAAALGGAKAALDPAGIMNPGVLV